MNIFLVIGNIINFIYNLPQMVKTYKTKSTRDFSSTFLFLRVIGNTIWLAYSIEINSFLFMLCNVVSVGASVFISYYKLIEMYKDYTTKVPTLAPALALAPASALAPALALALAPASALAPEYPTPIPSHIIHYRV